MKKLLVLVCAFAMACIGAFAEEEKKANGLDLAGKLNIGYASGASLYDTTYGRGYGDCSGFELYPAVVIIPDKTLVQSKNGLPFYLGLEASLDMVFGSSSFFEDYKSTIITPGLTLLINYPIVPEEAKDGSFISKLTPYTGVAFGVPIQKTTYSTYRTETDRDSEDYGNVVKKDCSSTSVGFGMGLLAGMNYDLNEKIAINAEVGWNFLSFHDLFIRGGAAYHFQKK